MNDPCTDTSSLFKHFSVAVFGSGCVGKATAENLIRNHIGSVYLICNEKETSGFHCDHAPAEELTLNSTDPVIHLCPVPFSPEVFSYINLQCFDYIVDAMENIEEKLLLYRKAASYKIPLVSCMDTAGRIDPASIETASLDSYNCYMAQQLKALSGEAFSDLPVVYSTELPSAPTSRFTQHCQHCQCPPSTAMSCSHRRISSSCNAYVTAMASMKLAAEVIYSLYEKL